MQEVLILNDSLEEAEVLGRQINQVLLYRNFIALRDPTQAMGLAGNRSYSFVVVDAGIQTMDPMEFVSRLLKKRPKTKIVLTADTDQYAVEALQLGVLDYLIKPIGLNQLESLRRKGI